MRMRDADGHHGISWWLSAWTTRNRYRGMKMMRRVAIGALGALLLSFGREVPVSAAQLRSVSATSYESPAALVGVPTGRCVDLAIKMLKVYNKWLNTQSPAKSRLYVGQLSKLADTIKDSDTRAFALDEIRGMKAGYYVASDLWDQVGTYC